MDAEPITEFENATWNCVAKKAPEDKPETERFFFWTLNSDKLKQKTKDEKHNTSNTKLLIVDRNKFFNLIGW